MRRPPVIRPARLLARAAATHPDRISIIDPALATFTVTESWNQANRLAAWLAERGIGNGDRVAICAPNSAYHLLTWMACDILGAIFVPLGARLAPPEIAALIADAEPKQLILAEGFSAGFTPTEITISELHAKLCELPGQQVPLAQVWADDPAAIIYTSGTSGRPTGAIHTRDTMWWAWQCYRDAFDYGNCDRGMALAPMSHIGGFNGTTNDLFAHGSTVLVIPSFDPKTVARLIETHRITIGFAVPTMLAGFAQTGQLAKLKSWEKLLVGGSPLPEPLARQLQDAHLSAIHVWGMTETGGAGACLAGAAALREPHTCGWPFTFSQIRILPWENGKIASETPIIEPGKTGMITISGPHIVTAYWRDQAPTTSSGALITSDLGEWDEQGRLIIRGRASEVINSGGEKIFPTEVEALLGRELPEAEIFITGLADPYWGQRVVALSTAKNLDLERIHAVAKPHLAHYKLPKSLIPIESVPLTSTGKVDRRQLRELAASAR